MARIGIYGSSTAYGWDDPRGGGFAGQLKKTYMGRHVEDRSKPAVNVFNNGMPAQLIDETARTIQEDAERRKRRGHRGRTVAVLVLGSMESAIDKKTGVAKMQRSQFRDELQAIGEMMAHYGIEPVYLGPTPIDDTKTNPFVNEHGPGDYFETSRRLMLGDDIREHADKTGKPFIELWSNLGGYNCARMGFLSEDGLHVNDVGHAAIHDFVIVQTDLIIFGGPPSLSRGPNRSMGDEGQVLGAV